MTKRIPLPRAELSPEIRHREAELLAMMLRNSKLTLLLAEPGADKSSLLTGGLMHLLSRRKTDAPSLARALPATNEVAERRRSRLGTKALPRLEAVVYVDAWESGTSDDLRQRIEQLCPEPLDSRVVGNHTVAGALLLLQEHFGIHCLLVLDRLENLPASLGAASAGQGIVDQLVDAIVHPGLQTGFLLALDESAPNQLAALRRRLPGLDENVLRIAPIAGSSAGVAPKNTRDGTPSPDISHVQPGRQATDRRQKKGPPPRIPIRVDEVYAFIESTLSKTSVNGFEPGSAATVRGPESQPQAPEVGTGPAGGHQARSAG